MKRYGSISREDLEHSPQKKVYEPKWLAGTSAGDVMFQADYFLKESWSLSVFEATFNQFY